jgi:hypothetical protein
LPVYQTLGKFQIPVKPGKYSVWIDVIVPYHDFHYRRIEQNREETIELGRLVLTPGIVMFSCNKTETMPIVLVIKVITFLIKGMEKPCNKPLPNYLKLFEI